MNTFLRLVVLISVLCFVGCDTKVPQPNKQRLERKTPVARKESVSKRRYVRHWQMPAENQQSETPQMESSDFTSPDEVKSNQPATPPAESPTNMTRRNR